MENWLSKIFYLTKNRSFFWAVGLGFYFFLAPLTALAVPRPLSSIPTVAENQIASAERKLLQRTFPLDSLDKRLQRLELLVFGASQMGSFQERWEALDRAINMQGKNQTRNLSTGQNKFSSSISEIERSVFKKSNPQLSASQRLDRLEQKLFGQTSPGMPIAKRVERLRKTVGLGDFYDNPQTAIRPFGTISDGMPNGTFSFRFYGDPRDFDPGQMNPQMSQLFRELNRQMRQMERFGDGMLDDNDYPFSRPFPNAPRTMPYPRNLQPQIPRHPDTPDSQPRPPVEEIPPYGAPNSI